MEPLTLIVAKRDARALTGHPWIYAGEVAERPSSDYDGQIADVVDRRGVFLGRGLVNTHSAILVRLLSRVKEPIDRLFFRRRLEEAIALRERLVTGTNAYRLVFSEADGLPGLVVDRYHDVLVIQILSLALENWRNEIAADLGELIKPRGIYERSESSVRHLEGLEPRQGFFGEPFEPMVVIEENGLRYRVDVVHGQKTGFFLDQRENRRLVGQLAKGARVLNTFCYTGGFSLAASRGGAQSVHSIDVSEDAIRLAEENARLNRQTNHRFEVANVFDRLPALVQAGVTYDLVVLDPPAFTKSKTSVPGAMRGYKELNLRALKLLEPGGLLVTCSCSHHLDPATFQAVVQDAARDARRRVRLLYATGPGPDHPRLLGVPETDYLKCLVLEVR